MPNYALAIEMGKRWMKMSKDDSHEYEHAEIVASISKEILQELKTKNFPGAQQLSPELVEITAWWHDCYIAQTEGETFLDIFIEGHRAAKIIKKELYGIIPKQELSQVVRAVRLHVMPGIWFYFTSTRFFTPLDICLLESDGTEAMKHDRLGCVEMRGTAGKIANFIFKHTKGFWHLLSKRYFRTDTAQRHFIQNLPTDELKRGSLFRLFN